MTPQVLRATFNTLAVLAHVDRATLRAMIGHTTEATTQRYAGIGDDAKRAAVVRLFGQESTTANGGASAEVVPEEVVPERFSASEV